MVLSNAERQARYRKNLRKRATDAGASARAAADAAAAAIYAMYQRIGEGSLADYQTFEAWRADYFNGDLGLGETCRALTADPDFTDEERAAVIAVAEIEDALKLKHHGD